MHKITSAAAVLVVGLFLAGLITVPLGTASASTSELKVGDRWAMGEEIDYGSNITANMDAINGYLQSYANLTIKEMDVDSDLAYYVLFEVTGENDTAYTVTAKMAVRVATVANIEITGAMPVAGDYGVSEDLFSPSSTVAKEAKTMLFEFLGHTTGAGANIAFLDFDDLGKHPGRLTVALTLDNDAIAYRLLEELKLRWRLEILEYDSTGKKLDDTVFYIRFAQELREIIGTEDEEFLFRLLNDSNHIAQELTSQDRDPHMVFRSILQTGHTLRQTAGAGFYSVYQEIPLSTGGVLYCFQLPCGGSVYLLRNAGRVAMS